MEITVGEITVTVLVCNIMDALRSLFNQHGFEQRNVSSSSFSTIRRGQHFLSSASLLPSSVELVNVIISDDATLLYPWQGVNLHPVFMTIYEISCKKIIIGFIPVITKKLLEFKRVLSSNHSTIRQQLFNRSLSSVLEELDSVQARFYVQV